MTHIACFGEALIDFLAQRPAPREGLPAEPVAFIQHAGGAPANVAVGAATLGAEASFIGMLGTDMFGDFLLESLRGAGVDTRWVRRTDAAPTALAFVSLDAHGERSFSFRRPPAADLMFEPAHFDAVVFGRRHGEVGIFHCCSNSLTDAAIAEATFAGLRRAREHGSLTSFDMNLRPRLWPAGFDPTPRLWTALALADVVKLSTEEMAFLVEREGSEAAVRERLWTGATRWLLVTDGGGPLRWYTPAQHGEAPVFKVDVVDSTAAGDAFVAGLLTALAEHAVGPADLIAFTEHAERRQQVLRFAAACGALAVTRRGAFAAMPRRSEVHALMEAASNA